MAHEVNVKYVRPSADVEFPTADENAVQEEWDTSRRLALVDNNISVTYQLSEDGLTMETLFTAATADDWNAYMTGIQADGGFDIIEGLKARCTAAGITMTYIVNGEEVLSI
jgi:hypothetical protein